MNDNRRVGEDFVFSLPKDVGAFIMLLAPAERDALLAMVERAGRSGHADDRGRCRNAGAEGRGLREPRPARAGLGGYLHTTARPVPGTSPDPHPHWHMFAFNATRDPVEGGRIKAADFANIYRDRPFYEAPCSTRWWRRISPGSGTADRAAADGKWGLAGLQPMGDDVLQADRRNRGRRPGGSASPMPPSSRSWGQRRARRRTRNCRRRSCVRNGTLN